MDIKPFKSLAILSTALALTACLGESEEESSTLSVGTATTFGSADVSGKRFYTLHPNGEVMTLIFSSSSMNGGPGYIDASDTLNSTDYLNSSWSISANELVMSGLNTSFKKLASETDFISVCEYTTGSTANCTDDYKTRWYTDKSKAKSYAASLTNATSGTAIDLSKITDTKLKKYFEESEYDFAEQAKILYAGDWSITSLAGVDQFSGLNKVWLYNNHISDISPFDNFTGMQYFDLTYQTNSTSGDDINLADYAPIYKMTSLARLALSEYGTSSTPTKFELDNYLSAHTDKSKIKRLRFYSLPLDQNDVNAISGINNLERLAIEEATSVTSLNTLASNNDLSGLNRLELGWNGGNTAATFDINTFLTNGKLNFNQLEYLSLANTTLSDANLLTLGEKIGTSSVLKRLNIMDPDTATDYDFGGKLKVFNLERLQLRTKAAKADYDMAVGSTLTASKIKRLYLENGDINNFTLSDFSSLERLRVSNSDLSDTTVAAFATALKGLSNLKQLRIIGTKVAGTAITCSDLSTAGYTGTCTDS